jgi:diguanylate cyclase (GGDEF)-like protein
VDALWSVGLILVGAGAWAAGPSIALPAVEQTRRRRGGLLPALTFMILAGVEVAFNASDGGADLVLGVGLSIIGVTLIAHAWVLQRHEALLFAKLRERESDLAEANRRLGEESRRDPLTGLGNRLRLGEDFADLAALAKRYGQGFCLVLIDLDRFKDYNDEQGHQAGDRVLRHVGALLKENGREVDLAYRYGGEELLLILRHQGSDAGQVLAERRRVQLQDAALPHPHNVPHGVVTFSAGVAAARDGEMPEQVLRRADAALYDAKAQGRNRVAVAAPAAPSGAPEPVVLTHR